MTKLDLRAAEPICHQEAVEAFERGDGEAFVDAAYSWGGTLAIIVDNLPALKSRGIYESAVVHGFTGCKTNHSHWSIAVIESLFRMAGPEKLRAVGLPLPGPGPFTVYRGVGRQGRERQISGMSWTLSLDVACKFAWAGGHDPAVYKATVKAEQVYCFFNERHEEEFICRPKSFRRLPMSLDDITERAARHVAVVKAATAQIVKLTNQQESLTP
jgi:hypothetical protein